MIISTLICYLNLIRSTSSQQDDSLKIERVLKNQLKISGGNASSVIDPEIFKNYSDVEILTFYCTHLSKFPEGVGYMEKLTTIRCIGNNEMTDFTNLNNLPEDTRNQIIFLEISHTEHEDIPIMFDRFKQLTVLDLSCNKFKKVSDSITSLTELQFFFLSFNELEELPANFGNLNSLKTLKIDHNKINHFSYGCIKLQNLESINASHNLFSEMPIALCFSTNLKHLNFDNNNIESIIPSAEQVQELTNIDEEQKTSLSSFVDFSRDLYTQFYPNIFSFSCASNQIKVVPDEIKYLKAVKILNLSQNKIVVVSEELLKLPELVDLNLAKNKLKRIPFKCDEGQAIKIKFLKLDISQNIIQELDDEEEGLGLTSLKQKFIYNKDFDDQLELE